MGEAGALARVRALEMERAEIQNGGLPACTPRPHSFPYPSLTAFPFVEGG